jgi:nitrite reductase (NADH) large subunit
VAGLNMAGAEAELPAAFISQNALTFFGYPAISFGQTEVPEGEQWQTEIEVSPSSYRKVVYRDGRLCGAIFQGDLAGAGTYGALIGRGVQIGDSWGHVLQTNYTALLTPEGVVLD